MRVEYDPKHDLMNIEFLAGVKVVDSVEVDGLVVDYDRAHRIVSIEILDVSKRMSPSPLDTIEFAITKEKV